MKYTSKYHIVPRHLDAKQYIPEALHQNVRSVVTPIIATLP